MATRLVLGRQGVWGSLSIGLALFGLLLFWLQPFGVILSGAGILAGMLGVGVNYAAGGRPLHQAMTAG